MADFNKIPFHVALTREKVKELLLDFPQAMIFWDADHPGAHQPRDPLALRPMYQLFQEVTEPHKIFAITDRPLNENLDLSELGGFGHHLFRRYGAPATEICTRIFGAALQSFPFGIQRYIPEGVPTRSITLQDSSQKTVAVQAIQNVLQKSGVADRLSALVAQAMDELMLNAIYDAPVDKDGKAYLKAADRSERVIFKDLEKIEVNFASCEQYVCLGVADRFGSLKKEIVLSFIRQNFRHSEYNPDTQTKKVKGLGLNGIIQSGLSLLFICQPKSRTEVYLFVPRVKNFRDFRMSFRFLSLLSE